MLPSFGYCKQRGNEHRGACYLWKWVFASFGDSGEIAGLYAGSVFILFFEASPHCLPQFTVHIPADSA